VGPCGHPGGGQDPLMAVGAEAPPCGSVYEAGSPSGRLGRRQDVPSGSGSWGIPSGDVHEDGGHHGCPPNGSRSLDAPVEVCVKLAAPLTAQEVGKMPQTAVDSGQPPAGCRGVQEAGGPCDSSVGP
jgi:hypothetical protein